jgi:hypothetical protein
LRLREKGTSCTGLFVKDFDSKHVFSRFFIKILPRAEWRTAALVFHEKRQQFDVIFTKSRQKSTFLSKIKRPKRRFLYCFSSKKAFFSKKKVQKNSQKSTFFPKKT